MDKPFAKNEKKEKREKRRGREGLNFYFFYAIIEAEMRKHEVFMGISAPCSNVACLCCNGSENTGDPSMQLYFRVLFKHGVSML